MSKAEQDTERLDYTALFEHLRHKYTEHGLPLKATFELTPRCTLNCHMCYMHVDGLQRKELSTEQWLSVMRDACDAGLLYAGLSGGECTLHPGFAEIYRYLKSRGVFVTVQTNGTLVDETLVSLFSELPPRSVRTTLYGADAAGYERITGHKEAFEKVVRGLKLLKAANIRSDITLTVTRQLFNDLPRVLALASELANGSVNVDSDLMQPQAETGRELNDFALSMDEQAAVWRQLIDPDKPPLISDASALGRFSGMPCTAGLCSFWMNWEGVMTPCLSFPLAEGRPLDEGFLPAWKRINAAAKAYRRSDECLSCPHLNICKFCPARYALASGGLGARLGARPCNVEARLLPMTVAREVCKTDGFC